MKRKDLLKKRMKLHEEIELLFKKRMLKDCIDINKEIEEKKKLYKFYSELLKRN